MGKLQDWEMVIKKYQRKNGSLFNSLATTAATRTHRHLQDAGSLNHIRSLFDKFGNAVPTVYPLDIYVGLCMIDNLERLGIDCQISNFLKLAVEDFNISQSKHREEIDHLDRWVIENRLNKLKLAGQKTAYASFSAAATIFSPELSDARMSWAKNAVLTTVVDDFFDIRGSVPELVNLIQLVEKWNVNIESDCQSEQVRIVFSALCRGISEIANQAFMYQRRSVTSHILLDLLESKLREAESSRVGYAPTTDGYTKMVKYPLPQALPALYVVGPKLLGEAARSSEVNKLFKLMSKYGVIKKLHGGKYGCLQRELEEGKLNAISLRMIHGDGGTTKQEAVKEARRFVESQEEELLTLVEKEKGSVIPRAYKELFWKMS
ncbi:hypothetical protein LguiA_030114 [Lonicera macranthoides]